MDPLIQRHLDRIEARMAESSYETHRCNLRGFQSWLKEQDSELQDLTAMDLEGYFLQLKKDGYAPNTISSRYESVRSLFKRLAGRYEVIEETPFEDLERKGFVEKRTRKHDREEISYVSDEEKEALVEHVPSPTLRIELIIRLLWQPGIRNIEAINIELSNLDRDERYIKIWSNKSKEWRPVFYQPSLDVLLDQWVDGGYRSGYLSADESPYLFLTERSEQFGECTIGEKIVKPAAEAAGIQEVMYVDNGGCDRHRVTPHTLRHGHAVHALKSGIDVRAVQKHLGHASLEMTMRYLQLIDEDVKDAYHESWD